VAQAMSRVDRYGRLLSPQDEDISDAAVMRTPPFISCDALLTVASDAHFSPPSPAPLVPTPCPPPPWPAPPRKPSHMPPPPTPSPSPSPSSPPSAVAVTARASEKPRTAAPSDSAPTSDGPGQAVSWGQATRTREVLLGLSAHGLLLWLRAGGALLCCACLCGCYVRRQKTQWCAGDPAVSSSQMPRGHTKRCRSSSSSVHNSTAYACCATTHTEDEDEADAPGCHEAGYHDALAEGEPLVNRLAHDRKTACASEALPRAVSSRGCDRPAAEAVAAVVAASAEASSAVSVSCKAASAPPPGVTVRHLSDLRRGQQPPLEWDDDDENGSADVSYAAPLRLSHGGTSDAFAHRSRMQAVEVLEEKEERTLI